MNVSNRMLLCVSIETLSERKQGPLRSYRSFYYREELWHASDGISCPCSPKSGSVFVQ
jgi:hypothetical protein